MAFISHPLPSTRARLPTNNRCPIMKLNVLVTGAGGRTGGMVFEKLQALSDSFSVTGMVHSMQKARDKYSDTHNIVEGDITNLSTFADYIQGRDAMVVLTSSVPRNLEQSADAPPKMGYPPEGMPELVDWQGAKNQIDRAKECGVKHIVFVGSMGSTEENSPLNKLGNGNILKFKRKAEVYLIESGIPYTIINPSGLTLEEEGVRELVVGNSDKLFSIYERATCSIPRGDVARVVVAALQDETARNKAFDLIARPVGDGQPTTDLGALFSKAGPDL